LQKSRIKAFPEKLPEFPSLVNFDMKEGKLAVLKDMVKVGQWPNCTSVDVTGTPIEDAVDNIKMELLIILD